jgi:hypothetical protein
MGKRTHRWTPAQPDPKKTPPPSKIRVADTPVSIRRKEKANQPAEYATGWGKKCLWPGCDEYEDIWYDAHLCRPHANHVRQRIESHERREADRVNRDITTREATRQRNAEKLDAGQHIDTTSRHLVPGWVYYVLIDGLIKIGFAKDVPARLRQYPPTAQLLAVEPGTLQVERRRHQQFGLALTKGREWFADTPELRQWVAKVIAEYGAPDDHAHTWGREQRQPTVAGKRHHRGYAI